MIRPEHCLNVCPVQCWAAENSAVLMNQSNGLHDNKELAEVDRELTAAEYLAKLDENAKQGADSEAADLAEARRTWLAQEYTALERGRDDELRTLDRELDGREEAARGIQTTGALALKTCSGVEDGLCTGDMDKEYLADMYQAKA